MLEENLENAITFKKSESGYHQNPIDRDLGLTKSQNGETSFQRTCPRLQRNYGACTAAERSESQPNERSLFSNTLPTYLSMFQTQLEMQRICPNFGLFNFCGKHKLQGSIVTELPDHFLLHLNHSLF